MDIAMHRNGQRSRNALEVAGENERLPWIDLARGICIILVVMMHFDEMHYSHLPFGERPKALWDALTSVARPARMPTFFIISGLLASRSLDRPFAKVWDNRIALLYYVYIIWSLIFVSTLWFLFRDLDAEAGRDFVARFGGELIFPRTQIWFLYALALSFIVARLLRRWPVRVLIIATAVSVVSGSVSDEVSGQMIRFFPYYLAGVYFPSVIINCIGNPSWKKVAILGSFYIILLLPIITLKGSVPGIWIPASIFGIMLIFNVSYMMNDFPCASVLKYAGRNSLPIFVMHGVLLLIIKTQADIIVSITGLRVGAYVYPVVGNVLLISMCLAVYLALKQIQAGWLFTLPDSLRLKSFSRRYPIFKVSKRT